MHRLRIQHVVIVVSLSSCANTDATRLPTAGDGTPSTTAGSPGGSAGTSSTTNDGTSFETSVQPFITKACNCHQSTPLMAPFSLKAGEAYKAIVNVPSSQLPAMLLIKPGSTQESYLWHKVNGTFTDVGGSGMIMPFTLPLNTEEKKIFERWITAGAKP
jgi:hypothetical protein